MSSSITVRLVPVPGFRVYVGDIEMGIFQEEGRWQGMLALSDGKGGTLVVDMPGRITELMSAALKSDVPALVVKASPAVLDVLLRAQPPAIEPPAKDLP